MKARFLTIRKKLQIRKDWNEPCGVGTGIEHKTMNSNNGFNIDKDKYRDKHVYLVCMQIY